LRHLEENSSKPTVDVGIDLTEFYMSVEWDILEVRIFKYEHKNIREILYV
jgi:hypothetical protein